MGTHERRPRLDSKTIAAVIDHLDRGARGSAESSARRFVRHSYREVVTIELEQPDDPPVRCVVPTRNISQGGLAVLTGHFVYPGTGCRVHLVTTDGEKDIVDAKVVRCRYLVGTASLHEANLKFDRQIDVGVYKPLADSATGVRVLLCDADVVSHRVVERLLDTLHAELTCVADGRQAVEQAMTGQFDAVLLDLDLPEMSGLEVIKELRSRGCTRPLIVVSAVCDEDARAACLAAGCDGYIAKPPSRVALVGAIRRATREAVGSSLAGQPDTADLIDQFVASLPERIEWLEEARQANDLAALACVARQLKGTGAACGFNVITDLAKALENAIKSPDKPQTIRTSLDELIGSCRAARPVKTCPAEPANAGQPTTTPG